MANDHTDAVPLPPDESGGASDSGDCTEQEVERPAVADAPPEAAAALGMQEEATAQLSAAADDRPSGVSTAITGMAPSQSIVHGTRPASRYTGPRPRPQNIIRNARLGAGFTAGSQLQDIIRNTSLSPRFTAGSQLQDIIRNTSLSPRFTAGSQFQDIIRNTSLGAGFTAGSELQNIIRNANVAFRIAAESYLSAAMSRVTDGATLRNVPASMNGFARPQSAISFGALAKSLANLNFRVLDSVVPTPFVGLELSATARVARLAGAESALAGSRYSMLGAHTAEILARVGAQGSDAATKVLFAELARTSAVTARLTQVAAGVAGGEALRWPSQAAAVQMGAFLHGLPPAPTARDLWTGVSAGNGTSALVAVDLLMREPRRWRREQEQIADMFEAEVAPSWLSGPARARVELQAALKELDTDLPDLLEGAWDDVERAGAAATVKISACAVELLERTLRALTNDADVLSWHSHANRPADEIVKGRPTYGCRVRYLVREPSHDKERRLVVAQVDAAVIQINELRRIMQSGKHASAGTVTALRGCLLAVEAILHQLTVVLR